LRPPISNDLEAALWRQWQISLVITKASGSAGGEDIKRKVAAELGVSLVVITRPDVAYPLQTSDLLEALEFCRKYYLQDLGNKNLETRFLWNKPGFFG
jgi:precorrin-6A/cobalt-precorrin-6A reductase